MHCERILWERKNQKLVFVMFSVVVCLFCLYYLDSIEFVGVSKALSINPTTSMSRNVESGNFLLLSETGELLTWNSTRQSKDDDEEQPKRIPNLFIGEYIVNVIVSKTRYSESNAFNSYKVAVLTKKGEVHLFRYVS